MIWETSVMDRHRFYADPDPNNTFHFDAGPDPTFHFMPIRIETGSYPKFYTCWKIWLFYTFIHSSASLHCLIFLVRRHRCNKLLTEYWKFSEKYSLAFNLAEMDMDPDPGLQALDADPDQDPPDPDPQHCDKLSLTDQHLKKALKTLNGRRGSPPQTSLRCSSISVSVSTSRPRNASSWPSGKILYCYCRYYFVSAYFNRVKTHSKNIFMQM